MDINKTVAILCSRLIAVPAGLLPEVFAIATITDPDIEVCVDHHLMLWARVRNWDDYKPLVDGRYLGITYEETFQEPLATVVVLQLELAETFLDQKDEGQAVVHVDEYDELEDDSGELEHKRLRRLKESKFQKEKVRDRLVHLQENQEEALEQRI